jgi:hypothetical protein
MSAPEPRPRQMVVGRHAAGEELLAKFDSFDLVLERAAISLLKLASWITTVAVVLYGLWRSL